LYYRLLSDVWTFKNLFLLPNLAYLDIIVVAFAGLAILSYNRSNRTVNVSNNGFFSDESINSNTDDELGYDKYAKTISEKIKKTGSTHSFAIGINGKWGSGKTTFLNFLKIHLNDEEFIQIDFNPWQTSSPDKIIKNFFEVFYDSLRPFHSNLSNLLLRYSDKLTSEKDTLISKTIRSLVYFFTGYETISELHKDIDKSIERVGKKIIVFVDDLDRLDKKETIEVIRLIRNTASFRNTFFIVAYDRNYVITALKDHNSYKREEFLEKIFQLEVNLPLYEKVRLREKLVALLKEKLPDTIHKDIENEILGDSISQPRYLNEWIESMRDVTRLANSIILNFEKLIGEVNFFDFVRLELLRLKYPAVYQLLYQKKSNFLQSSSGTGFKNKYSLKIPKEKEKTTKSLDHSFRETEISNYIKENYESLLVPTESIGKVLELVEAIFKTGYLSYKYRGRDHLSVVYPSRFNLYFTYSMLEGSLSENEFVKFRSKSVNEFKEKIDEWVTKGLQNDLKIRFIDIQEFDDRKDFEKIISAIFHLGATNVNDSYTGYYADDLISKLANYDSKLSKKYYKGNDIELNRFVNKLFYQAKSPFEFQSNLVRYLKRNYTGSIPLDVKELKKISLHYLEAYASETSKMDYNLLSLFYDSQDTVRVPPEGNPFRLEEKMPQESKKIMKDFILNKDLDGYLTMIITSKPPYENKFGVGESVKVIFDSYENFEEELNNYDEDKSKYLNEFKQFWKLAAENDFQTLVEFNFQEIPLERGW
jgi:hypothetical protein